jgi:hypothetical protein
MENSEQIRNISLVLGCLLAVLAVSFVSSPAWSEDWRHRWDNAEGWGGMRHTRAGNAPMRVTSRLFSNNDDCATVKLDVWLERGILTYTLFNPGNSRAADTADFFDEPGRMAMLIGEKNCRVRIVIEREDGRSGSK